MSEEQELEKPNFRSSYYVSLGVRAGEQSLISQLEGLIKAEAIDLDKLKSFCLKHTTPAYYRSRVWKLLLGVVPPYNDEKTCSFVRSQKEQQFQDLKHALQVMGRLGHPSNLLPISHCSSPEDFVLIYLLENDRLLSPAVNQLRLEHQVDLCAIAQAFLTFFDGGEEEEVETYWLFSKFSQKWESQQQHFSSLCFECLQCLEEVDAELYYHLKLLNALNSGLPFGRWFNHCFAAELPESCLESNGGCILKHSNAQTLQPCIWDKVIAGSCMILVYVAVAMLLSLRKKILGLQKSEDVSQLLIKIPKDTFSLTATKAIKLWESHGSMLTPNAANCAKKKIL